MAVVGEFKIAAGLEAERESEDPRVFKPGISSKERSGIAGGSVTDRPVQTPR